MKILHISKYYEPFKGGIEKVILELATGTVNQNHEVTVLCSNETWDYSEEIIAGVRVVRLPRLSVAFSQPLTMSFMWEIKKWIDWADVVQVHTPNPLAELACVLQEENKKPLLATYHCDVVRQQKLYKVYKPVSHKLLSRAHQITVSTPNHLQFSEPVKDFKDKVEVIPFGIRAKHVHKTPEINRLVAKIKQEFGNYYLFVGRLVPYKGVDVLLHALKQTNDRLVIIGQGPRWDDWFQLTQHLKLQDRVRFVGRIDNDDEFAAYIHASDALVLPSISEAEAFGIVLIEAMACGKPLVTTNLKSGVPWVNQKGVTGLQVEPKNPMVLAQALRTLSENHELRQKMGENARLRFEQNFTQDRMVNSYLSLYERMIKPLKVAA